MKSSLSDDTSTLEVAAHRRYETIQKNGDPSFVLQHWSGDLLLVFRWPHRRSLKSGPSHLPIWEKVCSILPCTGVQVLSIDPGDWDREWTEPQWSDMFGPFKALRHLRVVHQPTASLSKALAEPSGLVEYPESYAQHTTPQVPQDNDVDENAQSENESGASITSTLFPKLRSLFLHNIFLDHSLGTVEEISPYPCLESALKERHLRRERLKLLEVRFCLRFPIRKRDRLICLMVVTPMR
ncbi:hypothetical protein BV25DRAFT_310688 [Artomyces pyxidatus]|uniref:Uncharacterized protein n=1 Tax=Artomyces pyxidatus TaxID=48021 RepID=A0ACB8T8K3_9AGAM|nr:hypothetical protein BV25DRAFT_310688 [Artomyces pyxidatus]